MTAISGISGSGAQATSFDPAKGAVRFAAKVFGDMDTDKDGKVNKDEFVSGLESKGVSADDASRQFEAVDTQKSGSITQSDLETAIKSGSFTPPRPAAGTGGAGEAGGHQGGARPAQGAGGVGSASSAAKTYEAADSNEDGSVSAQEQLVYDNSHPSEKAADNSKIGSNIDQMA